jgi:putative ABC transport system permease protein
MSIPGEWFRRARYLLNRRRLEDDLRREMEAHRELMPVPSRFGNTLQLREDARDVWGWRWLDDLAQDVRYGTRALFNSHRTFAVTSLLTLAIGIGATTALFTVVSALMLRPLPFPQSERLVQFHGTSARPPHFPQVRNPNAYRRQSSSFDAMAGYEVSARYLHEGGNAERVMVVRTDTDFFTVLGVPALYGRTYTAADGPTGIVIGEAFWRRRLGSRPDAVGSGLDLDGRVFTIAGIMPEWFQFPYRAVSLLQAVGDQGRTDLWMPFDLTRPLGQIGQMTGRLKPGVTVAAAQAELNVIAARLEAENPAGNRGRGAAIVPLSQEVVPRETRQLLLLLFGAVGIVLVLACANVANLSLARMTLRHRELAVRAAIGASPFRLVRQLLAESVLLAVTGGLAGLLLAWWIMRRLVATAAPSLPRAHEIGLDWRVFAFMAIVCAAVGIFVAVAPAAIAARRDPREALQEAGDRGTMGPAQRRLRSGLVIAEVALAFVLGAGASVLLRELVRLRGIDAGLVRENVITFHVWQPRDAPGGAQRFYDTADRVAHLPGVRAAGFAQMLPLQSWGWNSNSSDFRVRGRPPRAAEFTIELRFVTPGYFDALGISIRRGRGFTAGDTPNTMPVVVINETLARMAFPGEDPIGLVTTRGTVVGTIADVRQVHLDAPALPEVYTAIAQNWSQVSELGMTLVVRTNERPEPLVDAIRSAIRDGAPDRAVFGIKTIEQIVADSLSAFTLSLSIVVAFALLAIGLALGGTYGVISYIASSRTREFAIRVALGADRRRVIRFVLGHGMALTTIGLALGVAAAIASAPLLAAAPINVRRPDVLILLPVAALIAGVAAAAALVPARRAARVDPMTALRSD